MPKAQKTPPRRFPQLLLIEASAGSGKTHNLSRRYVEYLLADGVPHNRLSNLLAITFTKNAAREMKERILDWLKRLALGADEGRMSEMQPLLGLEPAEISRRAMAMVDEAIERYSEFQVSTIDSFNNRLARASARELGFRPDFETTTSYAGLFDYALALMARDIGPGRDPELTARIDEFLDMLNIHGKDFPWDPQAKMRAAFESFIKIEAKETDRLVFADQGPRIQRCLDGIRRVYDEVTGFAEKNGLPCKPDENLLRFIAGRDVAGILSRRSFHDGHTPVAMSKLAKKESRELGERTRRMWGRTAPIVSELAEAYAAALVAPYHIPYRHFKDRLARAKRRQGIHHIDDIARELSAFLSREMIPEVYLKLGASIHHYLVDEFQDTDPAQWRSLLPLLEEALASDGSAFLVGDLKQAIYMFRQADYRIMKRLRDEIGGEAPRRWLPPSVSDSARVGTLGENHRSGRAIVDYAAMTFKKALPPLIDQGMFAGDRTGLCSYRQDPAGGNLGKGYVSVRHFPRGRDEGGEGDEDGGKGGGGREAAAETDRLRQALIGIVGDARRRGYGFHDIAVLARTNNELEQAIDWLTREGIPATSSSGLDVRQRRLVAEILALLRWLDSPIDNLSWAAVAGGRMLLRAARADGLPWDENAATGLLLAAGQRLGKGGYLFQECRREASFGPLWDRYFGELYKLSGFTPAYDLACLALERLRVLRCFPEEAAAVLRLLEAVNRLETGGATSVGDFLRECESGDPETFGLELPEHMDAVRLMTFYKAKGMGFPVVVNLISQFEPKGADHYHARGPGGITLYRIDKDIADRTRGAERDLAALKEDFLADQQAQELNSLYVACTRARDELHNLVSYGPPDSKGVPASYRLLFPEFSDGEKAQGPGAAELEPAAVPAASSARHPDEWRPEAAWTGQRFSDARLGEFIHLVLEDIEYLPADPAPVIAGLMERHRRMAPSADAGELGRKLCAFLADRRVSRWFEPKDGRTVEREVEFIDRAGRIVRMDRVVRDPEGVTVLDFKTGRETPASEARHREQMSEYLEVLAEATACGPAAGVIAYWDGRVTEVRP